MSEMELSYRGYAIRFGENSETWRCWSLDVEAEKLSTVKAKIDRLIAAARKLENPVPVIYVDWHQVVKPVKVIAFAQPRKDRHGVVGEPTEAWCMVPDRERYFDHEAKETRYRDVEKREKLKLEMLYVDTPENRDGLRELERITAQIKQLEGDKVAIVKSLTTAAGAFHITMQPDENA